MQITLTQKDFPFPYNCSDVWKQNKVFKQHIAFKNCSPKAYEIDMIYKQAYNLALEYILKHDEGGIAHALYNSNDK
jgi:hypothetical protein